MPYNIPNFPLKNSGLHFVSIFFNTPCVLLDFKQLTGAPYHLQSTGNQSTKTKQQSNKFFNTSTNSNRIGNRSLSHSHITYPYSRQVQRSSGGLHLAYPRRINRKIQPYRTYHLLFRTIHLNNYKGDSSTYTSYISYLSSKQEQTRRSACPWHDAKSILRSLCTSYRCSGQASTFMSIDWRPPNRVQANGGRLTIDAAAKDRRTISNYHQGVTNYWNQWRKYNKGKLSRPSYNGPASRNPHL